MRRTISTSILFFAVALLVAFGVYGCSSGGDSSTSGANVKAVILGGCTLNENGTVSRFIQSFATSDEDITSTNPATLQYPDGSTTGYIRFQATGITANNYYFGDSNQNYGSIKDPFTEYTQRQLSTTYTNYNEPFNGVYTVKMGKKSKDIALTQSDYMPVINIADIETQAGAGKLRVGAGDTITIKNQVNTRYRYFCRIYDTELGNGVVDNYWTWADVRAFSWTDTNGMRDFFLYSTKSPQNDVVTFDIPGGILNAGNDNLAVVITVYDSSAILSDTGGDFDSLTYPTSEVVFYLSGI